ncbi:MAG: transposase [Lentisphaerae bacterium]|nr:transposase [Lentisphaerota bacterium]
MGRKKWTAQEKFQIVMAGLKGRKIAELCNEYCISQGQYYKWRDVFLNDGTKLFERGGVDKEKERLEKQNRKLKETIGDLTLELKKNDW